MTSPRNKQATGRLKHLADLKSAIRFVH